MILVTTKQSTQVQPIGSPLCINYFVPVYTTLAAYKPRVI